MRRRAAIAAAVLSASSIAARAQGTSVRAQQQADAEVELEADRILYDWQARKLELEGHVIARRGPAGVLRAARGSLDRTTGILRLEGGVIDIAQGIWS